MRLLLLDESAAKLTSVVHGVIGRIKVPFPLPNPDGCKNSGLTCPLAANKQVTFKASIPVSTTYPSVS